MSVWQVHDAKAQLSEVIKRAQVEGPQTITRHGTEQAVVLSIEEYRALLKDKPDFADHLRGGPKIDDDFDIPRDDDFGRPIDL